MARTFALSYERLDPTTPEDNLAQAVLARAAYFAPGEPISCDLLKTTIKEQLVSLDEIEATLQAEDALNRLLNLGFLEQGTSGNLTLHRLLAAFSQQEIEDDTAQTNVEDTLLQEANRLNNAGYPQALLPIQNHLRQITDIAQGRDDEVEASLCSTLSYYLDSIGEYKAALPYSQRALDIRKKILGLEHLDTATSLNNLGGLLHAMGEYKSAYQYYQRALEIRKKAMGQNHPDTAQSLNNLGFLYIAMGDNEAARPYFQRALNIFSQKLGEDHPHTCKAREHLATLPLPPSD